MKKNKLSVLIAVALSLTLSSTVLAAQSTAPKTSNSVITNNVGKADTIKFTNLLSGDIIKIYKDSTTTTTLGKATVSKGKTEATVNINQLGISAGSVYATVTNKGNTESSRVKLSFAAEPQTVITDTMSFTITNNAGIPDTINVTGLSAKDIVRVYSDTTTTTTLGKATVSTGKSDATIKIKQFGSTSGKIYVTVTSTGKRESARKEVSYLAEATSTSPNVNNITINNNVGTADTISITGLLAGDKVNVYDSTKANLLGKAIVSKGKTDATIKIKQLAYSKDDLSKNKVNVTVTNIGKLVSAYTEKTYSAEPQSTAPTAGNITVTNNVKVADTVKVTGLAEGDIIKVYKDSELKTLLGKVTVAKGSTEATVKVSQLGETDGSIYATVTSTYKSESSSTTVNYNGEPTTALTSDKITVVNNPTGSNDIVNFTGLTSEDVVSVYGDSAKTIFLGTATVASGQTVATVSIGQIGITEGKIYITNKSTGKGVSSTTEKSFSGQPTTIPVGVAGTSVNYVGKDDTVTVTGLTSGDAVNVYNDTNKTTLLGTATVEDGQTETTVDISQLGTGSGNVYVAVTSASMGESTSFVTVSFSAEPISQAPSAGNITVVNNANINDSIKVTNLTPGDIVKVYSNNTTTTELGSATVASGSTEAAVSVSQIGSSSGSVYITVTSIGKLESTRTQKVYSAEQASQDPLASNILVTNNVGSNDTVKVVGLLSGDIIKVYNDATTTTLGTATVESGQTEAIVSIPQIGSFLGSSGTIYVTVTSVNKLESSRITKICSAEPQSTAPVLGNITVTNNALGIDDTVMVSGLTAGDIVKIYKHNSDILWLTATVAEGDTSVTITTSQIETELSGNSIDVTVTSKDMLESTVTTKTFTP